MKAFLLTLFICSGVLLHAQTTINNSTNAPKSPAQQKEIKHKILLVPFSNKLYMSEIDHVINSETKQTQSEIRWDFKDGIDAALYKELKGKYDVVSLIEDTAKNKKEIAMVEAGVGYKFDKVPDQKNYKAPKTDYKQDAQIKNGQIVDEINNDRRFMNAKLNDKNLLLKLNKKFKTDVFVFINELDIKASEMSNDFNADKNRTAVIHYTVFDLQGKEINSGIVTTKFPKSQNVPSKISSVYLSKAMSEIAKRVQTALTPQPAVTGK